MNMRQIEEQMNQAIRERRDWSSGNTRVVIDGVYTTVYLHENRIAYAFGAHYFVPDLSTLRAWPTPTTKSRLRALGVNVTTKDGVTYVDGEEV
jgi:hypothetical protein